MLPGQNFRWGQENGLKSGFGHFEHGNARDYSFARAHFSLKKPVHRVIFREIFEDFPRGNSLRAGEFERQAFHKFFDQRSVEHKPWGRQYF